MKQTTSLHVLDMIGKNIFSLRLRNNRRGQSVIFILCVITGEKAEVNKEGSILVASGQTHTHTPVLTEKAPRGFLW